MRRQVSGSPTGPATTSASATSPNRGAGSTAQYPAAMRRYGVITATMGNQDIVGSTAEKRLRDLNPRITPAGGLQRRVTPKSTQKPTPSP